MGKGKKKKSGAQQQQQQQQQDQAPAPPQVTSQCGFPSLSGLGEQLPSPGPRSSADAGAASVQAAAGAPRDDKGKGRGRGQPQQEGQRDQQALGGGRREDWMQRGGTKDEQGRGRGGQVEQRPGDWPCPVCNRNNFARNNECYKCKAPKPPGAQYSSQPQHHQQERPQLPQEGAGRGRGRGRGRGQETQQAAWQGAPQQQRGAWGGQQRQGTPHEQQIAPPQQQQRGAWGGQQRHDTPHGQQQQSAPPQQQQRGAWGGQQRQDTLHVQQQQSAPPQQQQRGAWGGQQRQDTPHGQQQQGASPPQQQRGACGGQQSQSQQHNADGGQASQRSPSPATEAIKTPPSQGEFQQAGRQKADQPETQKTSPSSGSKGKKTQPLGMKVEKYKVDNPKERPKRGKNFGTEGKVVKLLANHFEVKFPEDADLYHYDVEFLAHDRAPKKLKRQVVHEVIQSPSNASYFKNLYPCFDGQKNLYAVEPINGIDKNDGTGVQFDIEVEEEDKKKRNFKVRIKYAERYSSTDLAAFMKGQKPIPVEVIQVFDVALRCQALRNYIQAGRNIYIDEHFLNPINQNIGGGLFAWHGAFTSFRPGTWKLTLNVDLTTTAFIKSQDVITYMKEVLFLREVQPHFSLSDRDKKNFLKQLKGVKVRALHQNLIKRKYTVIGISRENALEHKFDCDGKKVTEAEYFQSKYNWELRFPKLQLLQVAPKEKRRFLPMEVCAILPNQKYPNKVNEKQVAQMIKTAGLKPDERLQKLHKIMQTLDFNKNKEVEKFGLSIADRPMQVDGRILDPPSLAIHRNKQVYPKPDDGSFNIRGSFFKSKDLDHWGIFNFAFEGRGRQQPLNARDLEQFAVELQKKGKFAGMRIGLPKFIENVREHDVERMMVWAREDPELQLLLCVFRSKSDVLHGQVKHIGDVKIGLMTLGMSADIVRKGLDAKGGTVLTNNLLKLNTRLGGINNILMNPQSQIKFLEKVPTLILGADVTHPAPSESNRPSISALSANMDFTFSRYESDVRVQGHRVEPITDLRDMVKGMLLKFHCHNRGSKPQRIIMYRDGVSEGQFDYIIAHELSAIQKACTDVEAGYTPQITFLVVQKRHHTRFFPMDKMTRNGNVLPGTVVDKGVTHPYEFDFFLNSHYSFQGMNKPAHYHVLYDDYGFTADELQKLTYFLCYTCYRCTRSISYPGPTYYAHLAAFRARHHLSGSNLLDDSDSGSVASGGSGGEGLSNYQLQRLQEDGIKVHMRISDTMYFN